MNAIVDGIHGKWIAIFAVTEKGKKMTEWISVNDRLPSREGLMYDENEYVLVAEQYIDAVTGEKLGKYVSICGFSKDGWDESDNFGGVRPDRVTHWMPLPSAPRKE